MIDPDTPEREAFLDDLAALVAGEQTAVQRHIDLLTDDDAMRDLRHDAREIGDTLRTLGDDYNHPADFGARLEARLDSACMDRAAPVKAKEQKLAAIETPKTVEAAPDKVQDELSSARSQKASEAAPSSRFRSIMLATGAVAAAAMLAVVGTQLASSISSSKTHAVTEAAAASQSALSAKLIQTERSANDGIQGLSVIFPDRGAQDVSIGSSIPAGSMVRTDSRTRAIFQLSDASTITLAPSSEILLDRKALRTLSLLSGELVADVAHLDDGPNANYLLPTGRIEVLGTKFALSADAEESSVRVLRGRVALYGGGSESVQVSAGEEGSVSGAGTLEVSPALHLADTVRWSELGPRPEEDRSGSGLGELRAYKPGHERDQDWPMALQDHKVTVRLVGNVARTEIEETFRNDSKTVLEGVYKFPLPAGAQIDSLALDVDGRFEEGAIVDKERAKKIWAGVIAKATTKRPNRPIEMIWVPGPWRDPAILEWQQGNRFELRIFPIPAQGTRTIKLAYTQTIAPHGQRRRYVYPLPRSADGSSVAEHFDIDMRLSGAEPDSLVKTPGYELETEREQGVVRLHLAEDAFVPNGDLVLDYKPKNAASELRAWGFQGAAATPPSLDKGRGKKQSPKAEVLAEQARLSQDARGYALLSLRPTLPRWTEHKSHDYVLVIDSSQSMVGQRFQRAVSAMVALVGEMDTRDRFRVLACDTRCRAFKTDAIRPSAKHARELEAWLGNIEPAGASYLEQALEEGAKLSGRGDDADRERLVIYVGDGIASMGHRSLAVLSKTARTLRNQHKTTITSVGIGADSDSRALGAIARAGGGFFIEHRSGRAARHLAEAVLETTMGVSLRDAELVLPSGISDVSPISLSTLRAGDEFLITGRYAEAIHGNVVLRGTVGGKPYENTFALDLPLSSNPAHAFVPKIWATQTIESLETEGKANSRDTVVALSKGYGVMSKQTSLLVLESEAMFKAFGVDRAKPLVQWTGEEGEADSSDSGGEVGYGTLDGQLDSALGGMGRSAANDSLRSTMARSEDLGDMDSSFGEGWRSGKSKTSESKKATRKQAARAQRMSRARSVRPRVPGSWMRKVWYREASIARYSGTNQSIYDAIDIAERELTANPDSRDRHRNLLQALAYAEDLSRAQQIAESWIERDRLDPEALAYLADIAARDGRRDDSIRLLSGVVDLRPDDKDLHLRLAKAYERAGEMRLSCAHRVVLAELDNNQVSALANAIRCESDNGRKSHADAIKDATPIALRGRALHDASRPEPSERVRGDIVLNATWTGGSDLDIAIITPTGRRISWQGGHSQLVAEDVTRIGSERLGLRRLRKGNYLIEISRTSPDDTNSIQGRVDVEVLGQKQNISFELSNSSSVVGRVAVRMRSRLEPM